jgi:hypothetical protein
MRHCLPGLDAALSDPGCERVELRSGGAPVLVFSRAEPGAWAEGGAEGDSVHPPLVRGAIAERFARDCDEVACFLAGQVLRYRLEGSSVRVRREPRSAEREGEEMPEVDLTPVAEALGIPRSRRRAKFHQARRLALMVRRAVGEAAGGELRVLDLACGRSYLGMVLAHLLRAEGRPARLHGVDSDADLIGTCRRIAGELDLRDASFQTARLESYSVEPDSYDVAIALHACDTLTDEAIRIACQARVPHLFVAPCCQQELRRQLTDHPLGWVGRYGLLEQRLSDVLTDAFRCLALEAAGYEVAALRFADPEVTPKNLLICGRLESGPRPERLRQARAFMERFGVRPRLAGLLDGLES